MASTNTPSVQWNVGDSVGRTESGGTVALPVSNRIVISTATAAPTAAPDGAPFYLAVDQFYAYDGSAWQGPYKTST